jgi:hypothetical protein
MAKYPDPGISSADLSRPVSAFQARIFFTRKHKKVDPL